jgi:serine/threonine-protein kinase
MVAGRALGRYRMFAPISAGGMGTVHFGRMLSGDTFSRTVAIKRLHPQYAQSPDMVASLLDEARLAARIRHVNVVPTLDVIEHDGETFVVMEYVAGESLAKLLRATTELTPLPIVAAVLSGVLHGLHAAHEATDERGEPLDIVHRDVSPQNILVGADGVARVLDFGIAKARSRLLDTTRGGQIKGKLAYMSPERLSSGPVDRTTDIYAAGVVLWECIAGERLFRGDDEAQLLAAILLDTIDVPSKRRRSEAALDAVTMRALAREPAERYQTAREFARAIEKAVPPATPDAVREWLEGVAGESLRERAARLEAIERAAPAPAAESSTRDLDAPGEPAGTVDREAPTEAPAGLERPASISVKGPGVLGLGGVALVAVAAAAFLTFRSRDSDVSRTALPAPAGAGSAAQLIASGSASALAVFPSSSAPPPASASPSTATPRAPPPSVTPATARPSVCKRVLGPDGLFTLSPAGCKL